MVDKLLYILNDDTKLPLLWLKCLDTLLNEPTTPNSIKVPKVIERMNNINIRKLWGLV